MKTLRKNFKLMARFEKETYGQNLVKKLDLLYKYGIGSIKDNCVNVLRTALNDPTTGERILDMLLELATSEFEKCHNILVLDEIREVCELFTETLIDNMYTDFGYMTYNNTTYSPYVGVVNKLTGEYRRINTLNATKELTDWLSEDLSGWNYEVRCDFYGNSYWTAYRDGELIESTDSLGDLYMAVTKR